MSDIHKDPGRSGPSAHDQAGSGVAERAADAGGAVWETARSAGTRMGRQGREMGEQAYDLGRQAMRGAGDRGLITFFAGAALGFGVAYAIYGAGRQASGGPSGTAAAIGMLNRLIAVSRDGEEGFRTSAEGVKSGELKNIFTTAAERCAEGARELERYVERLGGVPHEGGSTSGALHRRWVDLKSKITSMDDHAILEEVERGEDVAKAAYEKALKTRMPENLREIVHRQYQGVRQNHDRVRNLRDAAR